MAEVVGAPRVAFLDVEGVMSDFCPQCEQFCDVGGHRCLGPTLEGRRALRAMRDMRKTEVLREGNWVRARLAEVRKGERFRMFEDGKPFDNDGVVEFVAAKDGYWGDETGQPRIDGLVGVVFIEDGKETK